MRANRLEQTVHPRSTRLPRPARRYLEAGIAFVGEECKETVPSNPHNLAQSLLNLLSCMLDPSQGFDPTHPNIGTLLRLVFAWAFVWSVGANVDDASR